MVRIRLDLSQEEFARKLGVSTSFYTKLEQGYANPGMKTLEKFYRVGVNVNFLLSGEPPMLLNELIECLKECGEKKFFEKSKFNK